MTSQTASLFSYRELRIKMTSFLEEEILVIFMICGFSCAFTCSVYQLILKLLLLERAESLP